MRVGSDDSDSCDSDSDSDDVANRDTGEKSMFILRLQWNNSSNSNSSKNSIDEENGLKGNKGIDLRTRNVDELIMWANTLSRTAGLSYDIAEGKWNYKARQIITQTTTEWVRTCVAGMHSSESKGYSFLS